MSSWRPRTLFEEEVVAQQPDHNFVYGNLNDIELRRQNAIGRPRFHLENLENKTKSKRNENSAAAPTGCSLNVIRAVNEMAGLKRMGTETTYEDWDTRENVERETIGMIRACGMGPSVDLPLNKKITLSTFPLDKNVRVLQNGEKSLPIIYDDDFFDIKTTRRRNAELIANFERSSNESDVLKQEKKIDITPLLNDEKEVETIDEMKARKEKQFQENYPTLAEQKKIKNKKLKNESFSNDLIEEDILPTSYPPTDNSIIDESLYLSCSSNGSGSLNDCSFYTTFSESLDSSKSISKVAVTATETTQNYAKILQQSKDLNLSHSSSESETINEKQMFTPKDVYYIKHHFNNNPRLHK